ncbi:hypothetical protein COOONC_10558, partial [Cooperia oncophora]
LFQEHSQTAQYGARKKHALDLESVEIRVNEASEEDGIRRYLRATDESEDGMTENEVFELFDVIKENMPDFDPKLFMTDEPIVSIMDFCGLFRTPMKRGLFEGRYRLRQQHRQHEKAVESDWKED